MTDRHDDDFDRGFAAGVDAAEKMQAKREAAKLKTLDDVRKLSAEQIIARQAEVDAVLAKGGAA